MKKKELKTTKLLPTLSIRKSTHPRSPSICSTACSELQKKTIAYEAEKQRRAVAHEMLTIKLKLIDMEQQIKEHSQISGTSFCGTNCDQKSVFQEKTSKIRLSSPERNTSRVPCFSNSKTGDV
ncbi:hypothetical protein JTB14_013919 [Gonioctena quinquepunctata]|nr:hypothetical protein JTB14_013919 [Gonioctena quinquepunctata]